MRIRIFKAAAALIAFTLLAAAQQGGNYAIIRVSPEYADVTVDSVAYHADNGVVQCFLPYGKHLFQVKAADCQTVEGTLEITANARTEVQVKLPMRKAFLRVISEMPDVLLSIDGKETAGSSWEGYVSPGRHLIRAVKDEHQAFEQNVNIGQGDELKIVVPKLKPAKGSININIQPLDAEVFINGAYAGKSPLVLNNLDAGVYKIEVKKQEFSPIARTVRVKAGQMASLKGKLVAYEGVDLGLSVQWATFNVGATDPESEGDMQPWGEGKQYNYAGTAQVHAILVSGDRDAASREWGGAWRMPSRDEICELMQKCKWEYTYIGNTQVVRIVGPNGNHIIMPLGTYWANNRNDKWGDRPIAYNLSIWADDSKVHNKCDNYYGDIYYNDLTNYWCRGGGGTPLDYNGTDVEHQSMIRPVRQKP